MLYFMAEDQLKKCQSFMQRQMQCFGNSEYGRSKKAGEELFFTYGEETGETVEFEVSGDKIEAIYMIPGWTHNIINLSETDDLVTVMTCNEIFDPGHPDTFFEPV